MHTKIIIETKRVILRTMIPDDLEDLIALYSDPEVMRYIGSGVKNREETQMQLERIIAAQKDIGLSLYAVVDKETNRFIGRSGLWIWKMTDQEELEIGYMLDKSYWKKGLGREIALALRDYAFKMTDFPYFICLIQPGNSGSIKIAKALGMSFWEIRQLEGVTAHVYKLDRKGA